MATHCVLVSRGATHTRTLCEKKGIRVLEHIHTTLRNPLEEL